MKRIVFITLLVLLVVSGEGAAKKTTWSKVGLTSELG